MMIENTPIILLDFCPEQLLVYEIAQLNNSRTEVHCHISRNLLQAGIKTATQGCNNSPDCLSTFVRGMG